jgi:hypothetical protein
MKGPQRQFDEVHVLRTLLILEKERQIGRKELVKKLDLGEGSVRSVLTNLIKKNYVTSAVAKGHRLSDTGGQFVSRLRKFIIGPKIIDAEELTIGDKDVAILVRNAVKKVKLGMDERDAAIKIGSLGVTVLAFKNNELIFPGQLDLKINNEKLYKSFDFKDGDVLIIGTDNNYEKAENAAMAALLVLIGDKIVFE